jgi:GTPase SAR1 family protein
MGKKDRAGVSPPTPKTPPSAKPMFELPTNSAKVLMIGEEGIGKSGLLRRMVDDDDAFPMIQSQSMHTGEMRQVSKIFTVAGNESDRAIPVVPLQEGEMSNKSSNYGSNPNISGNEETNTTSKIRAGSSKALLRLDISALTPNHSWRSVIAASYQGCAAALFVYDPKNRKSFEDLKEYMDDVLQTIGNNPAVFVVIAANPKNLVLGYGIHHGEEEAQDIRPSEPSDDVMRPVEPSEGEKLAAMFQAGFLDLTEASDEQVTDVLPRLASTMMQIYRSGKPILIAEINTEKIIESTKNKDRKMKPSKSAWCCTGKG